MACPNRTVNGLSSFIVCPPDIPGPGSSTKCFTESLPSSRSKVVRVGRLLRTDSLNRARLSWRTYLLILHFTGDLLELPSGRAGANGNI
eukprot:5791991-Pleurochrysis_carterae.AAC.1